MALNYASVELEYIKNKELRREDVQYLQEWLKKQPHLPEIVVLELEIIFYLTSCDNSVEMVKTAIDKYYTLKGLSPEIFGKRDLKTLEDTVTDVFLLPLPKLTDEGNQIVYNKLNNKDVDKFVFANCIKYVEVIIKLVMFQKGTANGIVFIYDLEGFSFAHITKMPLMIVKKVIVFLQEAIPLKLAQIHFINAGTRLDKLMAIIKPFMNKRVFNMIHIHSDYVKTLYKYVPQECMPKEFGGMDKTLHELQEELKALLFSNKDFIEENEKMIANEFKRPQKLNPFDYNLGIEGTFKKLELD